MVQKVKSILSDEPQRTSFWVCPECETENPNDRRTCEVCGWQKGSAFQETSEKHTFESKQENNPDKWLRGFSIVILLAVLTLIVPYAIDPINSNGTRNHEAYDGETNKPILRVVNALILGEEFQPTYECTERYVSFSFPLPCDPSQSSITIIDGMGNSVSDESFLISFENEEAYIYPEESLQPGVYHLWFDCDTTIGLLILYYGYPEEAYLVSSGVWYCATYQNWLNGRYLTRINEELTTSDSYSERTFFETPGEIFGIAPDSSEMDMLVINEYARLDKGQEILDALVTLSYDGNYLAADGEGTVYMSEVFNDECYWHWTWAD